MKAFFSVFLTICVLAYGIYFYYIDTLSLSEIMGSSGNNTTDILVNLFDFDTGITRHEMSNLASKSKEWSERMRKIESIPDQEAKERERTRLVAEMMRDPAFKKLSQKLLSKGASAAGSALNIAKSYKSFGFF